MKTNLILFILFLSGAFQLQGQTLYCITDINATVDPTGVVMIDSDVVIESYTGQIDSIVVTPSMATCDDIGTPIEYLAEAYVGGSVVTSCTGLINIEDKLAPVAVGDVDVTVSLDPWGEHFFFSGDLDDGSYDNCSPVTFSYSPEWLTCSSDNPTEVTMTVEDESGNTNMVVVDVYIDYTYVSALACNANVEINVFAGPVQVTPDMILDGGPYPCIDQFTVACTDADGNPVGCTFDDTQDGNSYVVTVTDPNTGNSCWSDITITAQAQPYTICVDDFEFNPVKDVEIVWGTTTGDNGCADISSGPGIMISPVLMDDQLNGVDDIDMLLIREFILGAISFKGEQLLAADVNGSGQLTTLDLVQIEKAMIGEFDFEKSWVFTDADYDFQDNVVPMDYDEFIVLGDDPSYTFRGIKMGDVDLSYEQLVPEDEKDVLKAADIVLNKGEFYTVEVRSSELIDLVVANVQFPAETAEYRVTNISSKIESYSFDPEADINNNVARFRWLGFVEAEFGGISFDADETLFSIEIEALEDGVLSHTFALENVAGANKWKASHAEKGSSLKLEYTNLITVPTKEFELLQVAIHPNPAKEYIQVEATKDHSEAIPYQIMDITGKMVQTGTLSTSQQIDIHSLDAGIYFLNLQLEEQKNIPSKFIKQL